MYISGQDLITRRFHAIKVPTNYTFMNLEIPKEFKPYVNITPSDHNSQTAPQFFDFQNINVGTIRDGFEGHYFYKLKVKENFPDNLKGRLLSINVTLNSTHFDRLPGPKDPTGIHDYTLKIPPIKFGVEYPAGLKYAGKIFNTLGRANNIVVKSILNNALNVQDVKYIKEEQIQLFKEASVDEETAKTEMNKVWAKTVASAESIPFDVTLEKDNRNYLSVYFNKTKYAQFPKENPGDIDTTKFYFIVKSNIKQISSGDQPIIYYTATHYKTDKNKLKVVSEQGPASKYSNAKGAWLKVSYSYAVVIEDANGTYHLSPDQRVYATDSGVVQEQR